MPALRSEEKEQLIWAIWQRADTTLADQVAIEPAYVTCRDNGIGLTKAGEAKPVARAFVAFLNSPKGAAVSAKWSWDQVRHRWGA